jgi:hypothetical protein
LTFFLCCSAVISASPFAKAMGVEMIYKKETTQTWSMISETQSGLKSAYEILCK